ncbi:MAG: RnfABCDGE type electron transport complex subunit D, partial [Spirochaetales bacterium]|nr:RnfABCDGE type electron transport complex subunit D [Spirochaetales bacterium]
MAVEHHPLLLSSSPHVFSNVNVQRLMLNVIIALLPTTAYGIWLFGLLAVRVILTSVISCLVFEIVFRKLTGAKQNFKDLS